MKKTPKQINKKIEDLDYWLKANPNHPDYTTVVSDRRKLKDELIKTSK